MRFVLEPFNLPASAFVNPFGENRQTVEALMQQVVTLILDQLSQAGDHTPLPTVHRSLFTGLSATSVDLADLVASLQTVLAQSMNPAHPGYMGHMDPMPTTASILGDWVVAALNNNMLSVEMSPVFSRLEPLLMQEIAQRFGLGEAAGGVLVSGGSLANLQALVVARNVKLRTLKTGLAEFGKTPVILASELSHTSVQKAAMVAGLGTEAVMPIPTNADAQMDVEALQTQLQACRAAGQYPFALFATAGTTVTGNIDPLPALAAIAHDHDLWFHVDAAYGGALIFSPTQRHRLQGIERADSVTFNPQKWLYVTKTCASILFRDFHQLETHFRVAAPYMNTEAEWTNLGEITVQGTRHADVLKLWLSLQHLGQQGCAALIDASYALTEHFLAEIRQRPYLELASQPQMNILCFRGCPAEVPEDQWDDWNRSLQRYLLDQGKVFFSLPRFRGQLWFKAVLLNPYTDKETISAAFRLMDQFR